MIALFLDGGLRLSELTGLKLEDCNALQGYVRVLGKGRKERIIGISDEALDAIQQYLKYRPEGECPYLFVTCSGGQMTKNAVIMIFTRLRQKLGVPKLHAHLLRHTAATMHMMNGEDLVTLQRQLGHSHISVTQQYIGNVVGAQIKAHRETSPLRSLGVRFGDRRSRRPSR
jgi:site-specific recombinase XerD